MRRLGVAISALVLSRPERHTWYEQLLRQINPADIDYGTLWEQRKQDFIHQLGNPYVQYGLVATVVVVLLLVVVVVQRLSHRRSLEIASEFQELMRLH